MSLAHNYRGLVCSLTLFVLLHFGVALGQNHPGAWSTRVDFGIVPVAVANLPDGRLITWSSQFRNTFVGQGDGATFTELYDPYDGPNGRALGEFTTNTDHDMFCPGINNLADGRILSAGGTSSERTSIYDPVNNTWSVADDMNIPRGYQGNVTLSDGSVFTIGGSWDAGPDGNKDAERWTEATGWVNLPGIKGEDIYTARDLSLEQQGLYRVDNHVWLWPAPDGRLFHAGPSEMMHWIDVSGVGSITSAGLRADDSYSMKGTTVMFDIGKILKVGGATSYGDSDSPLVPAKDNSYVIDINNSSVTVIPTNNKLSFSRTMHNSTVLPNGEVLVTGGLDHAEVFTDVGARYNAEIYNPDTNSWRTVAAMAEARTYHSVAILMTNGKVFVGGGGLCDNSNIDECYNHFNAEIYSPPYLFDSSGNLATRPVITDAPETANYNQTINVTTDSEVTEFSLIRFSAATHSTNNEQRRIPLSTTPGTIHSLNIPGRNLLPPGYYMLFGLNGNGVPSIAKTVQIGENIALPTNQSLVLDLKFDNGSGSVATDASQYGNNATIYNVDNNASTKVVSTNNWGDGLFGGALQTDGAEFQSNTIAEIPYSQSLSSVDRFITVMAWVNRDEIIHNASIFTHDYPSMFFGFHNSLYKWEFNTDIGDQGSCYAGFTPTNKWTHIAATYDGSTARLYANGVEICSKEVSGKLVLNRSENNFSSFTTTGFYERKSNPHPSYNGSGVTDELDGRIDELKVFNNVLSQSQIALVYEQGRQTGNPSVVDCTSGTIVPEFKIGDNGTWVQGNYINVEEGRKVFIRARNYEGTYYITTPQVDTPTFSRSGSASYQIDTSVYDFGNPERNNGLVDLSNRGTFVLTTPSGCPSTIFLNVTSENACPSSATAIIPEYRINGEWDSGLNDLTVPVGTNMMFSILPNNLGVTVTLPDGTVVGDDHPLGNVTEADSGAYLLESSEGCQTVINLTVGTPSDCPPGSITPQYTVNGVTSTGTGTLTVDEGDQVVLSSSPDDAGLIITLPNGNTVGDNHNLGAMTPSQGGTYRFTSSAGCQATLTLQVNASNCPAGSIIPEYRINGEWDSGLNDLTVPVGTNMMFSILPNNLGVTVTLPDGTVVGDDHPLGNVTEADSGAYLLESSEGCQTVINLTVGTPSDCPPGSITPQYTVNGVTSTGTGTLTVDEGDQVVLSSSPDDAGLIITLPNGNTVGDNHNLGAVTPSQGGTYRFTNSAGCQATLTLQVNASNCPAGSITPQYTVNGVTSTGTGTLTVDEGDQVVLSSSPDDAGLIITLPNGNTVGDNHNLGAVTPSQGGTYRFTSSAGCQATLTLQVNASNCPAGSIIPEYRINGEWDSGLNDLTVPVGTNMMFSILPNNLGVTVTFPDGTVVGDDHPLGNVTEADSGAYLLESSEGCQTVINLTVGTPSDCPPGSITPQYTVNGVTSTGTGTLTVDEGDQVVLSSSPDDAGLIITLPNGNTVGDNHNLGAVTPSQGGTYRFTNSAGCQATLTLQVNASNCPAGSITPQYTVNGVTSTGTGTLTVDEGDQVVLSSSPDDAGLIITLPNGNTVGDNHNLGAVTPSQGGTYRFTSSAGCQATLTLQVNASNCPAGSIIPEYRINGEWDSGLNDLTVPVGTNMMFSILPNNLGVTVTFPDGTVVGDDYPLGNVTAADSGAYLLESSEGCQTIINLTVGNPSNCPAGSVTPEYTVNGTTGSGSGTLNVEEGDEVILSMLPDGVGLTITLPNGTTVGDNHNLGNVTTSQSGLYRFTTAEGCEATLNLQVNDSSCPAGSVTPEYTVNGTTGSGSGTLNVEEGDQVILSMLPDGVGLTITLPNGTTVGDNHNLGNVTTSQSGLYRFTTAEGCEATLNLQVNASNCPAGSIIPEYRINGEWDSGLNDLTVPVGTNMMFSILPNNLGVTVTLPDGTVVGDDHPLGNVTEADSGAYLLESSEGCQTVINLTVGTPSDCPPGSITPQYTVNGVTSTGTGTLTVDEGDQVVLSSSPDDAGLIITLPNGNTVGDNHNLGAVTPSQGGTYRFTSSAGCQATLTLQVNASNCPAGSIIPEYRINGEWDSGLNDLTVPVGTNMMFSILPNNLGVTVTLPDGTVVGDDHPLGNVTEADSGAYLLESSEGCQTVINLEVVSAGGASGKLSAASSPESHQELDALDTFQIRLAPNPTSSIVHIYSKDQHIQEIYIHDGIGRLIKHKIYNTTTGPGGPYALDFSMFEEGIYYIRIVDKDLRMHHSSIIFRR